MTAELAAAVALMVCAAPPAVVCWRATPESRMVGLALIGTIQSLVLLLVAAGTGQAALSSLGLVLICLSAGGSLTFARFLERWV